MPDPNLSSFIWSVADLLRGDDKQSDYGKVILSVAVTGQIDVPHLATETESPRAVAEHAPSYLSK